MQATCAFDETFSSVDCSWPGSVHDARIWRNSDSFRVMRENESNCLLLGDEGYGLAPWLMTPYRNPSTPEQISFNRLHKKERVIIERCFGQVKQRFPILQSKIRLATDKTPTVVVSSSFYTTLQSTLMRKILKLRRFLKTTTSSKKK